MHSEHVAFQIIFHVNCNHFMFKRGSITNVIPSFLLLTTTIHMLLFAGKLGEFVKDLEDVLAGLICLCICTLIQIYSLL